MHEYIILETGSGKWIKIVASGNNETVTYTSCKEDATTFENPIEVVARYYNIEWLLKKQCLEQHTPEYVAFNGDRSLGQNQYASRYVNGRIEGYPNLGEGLRWKNADDGNYHSIKIHKDDYDEFHRRVRQYQSGN